MMSDTTGKAPKEQHQEYYPPPPPGPPPGQNSRPQHPNETPIPEYNIPAYNPSNPQAPHYYSAPNDAELYGDDSPTDGASKTSWSQRLAGWGAKAATPLNALVHKLGSESPLPMPMDKECEKAARILKSFCKDGIYEDGHSSDSAPGVPATQPVTNPTIPNTASSVADHNTVPATAKHEPTPSATRPKGKSKVLLTIPSKVIARAHGLAIFTMARVGFQVSAATGSGILIARLEDGSWSAPSGIQVHSVGAGFVAGLDIYDCVVVINTPAALAAFKTTRMSLGSDLAVTAGPWGAGGMVDFGLPQGEKRKGKEVEAEKREQNPMTQTHGDPAPPAATHAGPAGLSSQPEFAPPPTTTGQTQPHVTTGTSTGHAPTLSAPTTTPAIGADGKPTSRPSSPFRDAIKKPVYSYVKSRGFYAGVQIDGTVITERKDANATFYGDRTISVDKILRGQVKSQQGDHVWPAAARGLFDILKGAEGWRGQQQPAHAAQASSHLGPTHVPGHASTAPGSRPSSSGMTAPGVGMPGVTAGMGQMNLGGASGTGVHPPAPQQQQPPPPPMGQNLTAKEAEAARETRANQQQVDGAPPSYQEPGGPGADLPPAYVDGGVERRGVGDNKGAYH